MTDKKELLGFLQDGLVFQDRDDVDERVEYYEIYDNGTLTVVRPLPGASFGTRLGNEAVKLATGIGAGLIGRIATSFGAKFDKTEDQSFTNDPRKGRTTKGVSIRNMREVQTKLQDYLQKEYGYNPANYDAITTWSKFAEVRDIEQSRLEGESFDDAFGRITVLDPRDPSRGSTFSGKDWLDLIRTGTVDGEGEGEAEAESERGDSAADAAKKEDKAAGLGTDLGVGAGIGANTLQPGGANGEITGDLLQQFVNSDFAFAFNASINELRDAKTAGVFLSWMQDNFVRIRGMFLGEIGEQALAGEVPKGSFADFLRRNGVLSGEIEGGENPEFTSFVASQNSGAGGGSSGGAVGPTPEGTGSGAATVKPSAPDHDVEPLPEAVAAVLGITNSV